MKLLKKPFLALAISFLFSNEIYAEVSKETDSIKHDTIKQEKPSQEKKDEIKSLIEEFKKTLYKLPEKVNEEITEYKKGVADINREKISLYKRLTQEAQIYLTKHHQYKKKLSFKVVKQAQEEIKQQREEATKNQETNTDEAKVVSQAQEIEAKKDEEVAIKNNAILSEYKEYLASVSEVVVGEVIQYRKTIAKLSKDKRDLYTKLSKEAQNFLQQERDFRKKLSYKQLQNIKTQVLEEKQTNDKKDK